MKLFFSLSSLNKPLNKVIYFFLTLSNFVLLLHIFASAFKIIHFVLSDDVRSCSSAASFQTTISKRLESHPTSVETSGLQATQLCFTFMYLQFLYLFFPYLFSLYKAFLDIWETLLRMDSGHETKFMYIVHNLIKLIKFKEIYR